VLRDYLPAIVFMILGAAVGGLFSVLNLLTGKRTRANVNRTTPYECGLPSEIQRGFRFGISFYLIAMLFILFDIEVIFLYPIAVQLRAFGGFALGETITFVILLMVAFVYVWRRGALEWK
jgi:NADH-quinone oxidoreductase subunit A